MDAAGYHAWYETPRGARIGRTERRLLLDLLRPEAGAALLDMGCGTGWSSWPCPGAYRWGASSLSPCTGTQVRRVL
jgi:hypothetical protein